MSMEVGLFLLTVQGGVGGIKVNDDFLGFFRDGLHSLFNNEVFNGDWIGHDFFVSIITLHDKN